MASVGSLSANGSVTIRFRARVTVPGTGSCTAQITASGQPDSDYTPGNGVDNSEDDTARTDVRVRWGKEKCMSAGVCECKELTHSCSNTQILTHTQTGCL